MVRPTPRGRAILSVRALRPNMAVNMDVELASFSLTLSPFHLRAAVANDRFSALNIL
jgi:hypothetical protein